MGSSDPRFQQRAVAQRSGEQAFIGAPARRDQCPFCIGTGWNNGLPCDDCVGTGLLNEMWEHHAETLNAERNPSDS